jgi:hypothetical protein
MYLALTLCVEEMRAQISEVCWYNAVPDDLANEIQH